MRATSHGFNRQSVNGLNELVYGEYSHHESITSSRNTAPPPNLFRSMLSDLLALEGYTESVIAMRCNLNIEIIRGIKTGVLNNPSAEVLGKLLRFYNKVICE